MFLKVTRRFYCSQAARSTMKWLRNSAIKCPRAPLKALCSFKICSCGSLTISQTNRSAHPKRRTCGLPIVSKKVRTQSIMASQFNGKQALLGAKECTSLKMLLIRTPSTSNTTIMTMGRKEFSWPPSMSGTQLTELLVRQTR